MTYTGIPASAKLVYARLVRYGGTRGLAYPSHSTLAEECGISLRCAKESLKLLEDKGFLIRKGTIRQSTVYGFLLHQCLVEPVQNVHQPHALKPSKPVQKVHQEAEESPTGAESAPQPVQKVHSTGAESAYKESHEESHERESCTPTIPPAEQPAAGSGDKPDICPIRALYNELIFGMRPDFMNYQELEALEEEYGADAVLTALHVASRANIRRRGVLPYVNKVLKSQSKEEEEPTRGRSRSDQGSNWR
jgi:hypothetical protein